MSWISSEAVNFDEMKRLYEQDAEAFERYRKSIIKSQIAHMESLPGYNNRLKGLQFTIDSRRRLSKSPMQSCINMSQQMWDSISELRSVIS